MNDIILEYTIKNRKQLLNINVDNLIKSTAPDYKKLSKQYLNNIGSNLYSLKYKLISKLIPLRRYDFPGNPLSPEHAVNKSLLLLNIPNNIVDNSLFTYRMQDYKKFRIYDDKIFLQNDGKLLSNYNSFLKSYNSVNIDLYNILFPTNKLYDFTNSIKNNIFGPKYDDTKKMFIYGVNIETYLSDSERKLRIELLSTSSVLNVIITSSNKYKLYIPLFNQDIINKNRKSFNNTDYKYTHNLIIIQTLNSGSSLQINLNNYFSSYTIDYGVDWEENYYIGSLLPIGTYKGFSKTLNILIMILAEHYLYNKYISMDTLLNIIRPLRDNNQVPIRKILKILLLGHIYYGILRLINRNINNELMVWIYDLVSKLYYPSFYSVNMSFNLISKKYGEF